MRTSKNPKEAYSRRFNTGVSRSFNRSSAPAAAGRFFASAPFTAAPYPASSTAFIISCSGADPSTPMELVSRLTEQDVTPGTLATAFSTRALQAAQLIPVTVYCSIKSSPL